MSGREGVGERGKGRVGKKKEENGGQERVADKRERINVEEKWMRRERGGKSESDGH